MADWYVEVATQALGSRLLGSIVGIPIGILLFIGGIVRPWWNEGRFDTTELARTAVQIDPTARAAGLDGKLVAVTGPPAAEGTVGDGLFLRPGAYVAVRRTVEMYAWKEESRSESRTNLGGSETTETVYTVTPVWSDSPLSSSEFKQRDGHELFRVFDGSRVAALDTLRTECVVLGWIIRLVGFLVIWVGLALVAAAAIILGRRLTTRARRATA